MLQHLFIFELMFRIYPSYEYVFLVYYIFLNYKRYKIKEKWMVLWCRLFLFSMVIICLMIILSTCFDSRHMQMSSFRARHSWRNVYLHVLRELFLFIVRFYSNSPVKSNCMPVVLMAFISSSWKFYCGLFIPILPLPRYIGYNNRHQHLCQAHAK